MLDIKLILAHLRALRKANDSTPNEYYLISIIALQYALVGYRAQRALR